MRSALPVCACARTGFRHITHPTHFRRLNPLSATGTSGPVPLESGCLDMEFTLLAVKDLRSVLKTEIGPDIVSN